MDRDVSIFGLQEAKFGLGLVSKPGNWGLWEILQDSRVFVSVIFKTMEEKKKKKQELLLTE